MDGVARSVAKLDKLGEDRADSRHVAGDFGIVEQPARLVLRRDRRCASFRRPSARSVVPQLWNIRNAIDADQGCRRADYRGAIVAI